MLTTIRNPFQTQVVADPWVRAEADVPHIHQPVFELCHDLIEEVAHGSGSTCLLIYGQAGSGKTHLLSRLRAHLEEHSEAVFISVRLQTVAPRIWRHIRRALAADLLRETGNGLTRLDNVLTRSGPQQDLDRKLGFSHGLAAVLKSFRENRYRAYCAAWLRGDPLPESVLLKLGLAEEDDDEASYEDQSNQVILHLCRLMAPLPAVFCFDQVEALEIVPGDLTGLNSFGKAVADLHAELQNLAVISSMQSKFVERLEGQLDKYIFDRLSLHRAALQPLRWREGLEVLRKRLDSEPELTELRAGQPSEPIWPLPEARMRELFGGLDLCLARTLIHHGAEQFEAARGGLKPDTRSAAQFLDHEYAARRERALPNPPGDVDELLLTAVPILLEILGKGGAAPLALEVLNHPHPSSVVSRLEKIEQEWDPATRPVLVMVRDSRLTIGPNAIKIQEIVGRLRRRGASLIQPSCEALAALDALRSLHADAQSGNLVQRGESVATRTVKEWFAGNIPAILDDFLAELSPKATADPFVSDLLDFLKTHSIVKLEEAAQAIQVQPELLADYARHHSVQIGYLAGPPAILFRATPHRVGDSSGPD